MNEKIDKLIDYFKPYKVHDGIYRIGATAYSRKEIRDKIRKILGIDKQCFQCLEYHFEHDLSVIEETGNLVCQDCAEGIIGGSIKVREQ